MVVVAKAPNKGKKNSWSHTDQQQHNNKLYIRYEYTYNSTGSNSEKRKRKRKKQRKPLLLFFPPFYCII